MNVVVLIGRLSRPAAARTLPSGDRVVNLEVTVAMDSGPAESAPAVWNDPPAWAEALDAGDDVVVVGRVRRRFFRAGGFTQSRTEVVAESVVLLKQAKRVEAALERARQRMQLKA